MKEKGGTNSKSIKQLLSIYSQLYTIIVDQVFQSHVTIHVPSNLPLHVLLKEISVKLIPNNCEYVSSTNSLKSSRNIIGTVDLLI